MLLTRLANKLFFLMSVLAWRDLRFHSSQRQRQNHARRKTENRDKAGSESGFQTFTTFVQANYRPPPGKKLNEWRNELNTMREPLKSEAGLFALHRVDKHSDIISDVHNTFFGRLFGRDGGYHRRSLVVRLFIVDFP
jgi:hypothetical protein